MDKFLRLGQYSLRYNKKTAEKNFKKFLIGLYNQSIFSARRFTCFTMQCFRKHIFFAAEK